MTSDELAQEIRRVDGENSLGAGALAEALMPFLSRTPAPEGEVVAWRWRNKPDGVWNYQEARQRIPGVEQQPLYASPVVPVSREETFPPPLFITSGGHLSGFRVSLGYETLAEASDAHAFLAALGTKAADTGREGWTTCF